MNKLFIPYHLAVIAKEKGWTSDIKDIRGERFIYAGWWFVDGSSKEPHVEWITEQGLGGLRVGAPLYQQIIDWFREKHKIFIGEMPYTSGKHKHWIWMWNSEKGLWEDSGLRYESSNEAIEAAFKLV